MLVQTQFESKIENMKFKKVCFFSLLFVRTIFCFQDNLRIDCHPDRKPTKAKCENRGCLWSPSSTPRVPWCIFSESAGYNLRRFRFNQTYNLFEGELKRKPTPSIFGHDFNRLRVGIRPISQSIVHILIQDTNGTANRVQHTQVQKVMSAAQIKVDNGSLFDLSFDKNPFGFALSRRTTGTIVFDTRQIPGLTFSEQFIQLSIKVPSQYVYGLGETSYKQLKHDFRWRKWGFFASDQFPHESTVNLYGVHPFYLCIEDNSGNSHGVFFLNSHAMDVFLQPEPDIITFRAIGGSLEFFIFAGPTPEMVVKQYTSIVGRPNMPPYWALGFQLSRFGYRNLTLLKQVFDRNRLAAIPQDVQFIDDDYMHKQLDFTIDPVRFKNLSEFVQDIHSRHMKLVILVDPAISSHPNVTYYEPLDLGLKLNIFINDNRTGLPLEGKVWPGKTFWPDFTKTKATIHNYWTKLLVKFHKDLQFDGVWIDMNEPSNFVDGSTTGCVKNRYNNPPYNPLIYANVTNKTICLDSDQFLGKHYSMHNLYGYKESEATYESLNEIFPKKRPFILSRSTFAGSGYYTNHWTGDNRSKWNHMRYSIVSILLFQMFGIPMTGSDICGFFGEASEDLCLRWMQLGSFYPYSRNHNDYDTKRDQDPASWSPKTVQAMREVLLLRYSLLPYLYTLFYHSHTKGQPVARPMFFDFILDLTARNINDQFLLGPALMIAPILEPNSTQRYVYFPDGDWYDFKTFRKIDNQSGFKNITVEIPEDEIGLFVKSATIIPCQIPGVTTFETRKNPYFLIVTLNSDKEPSKGDLYLDDGESNFDSFQQIRHTYVKFFAATNSSERASFGYINITFSNHNNYPIEPLLENIYIAGMLSKPNQVTLDKKQLRDEQIRFNDQNHLMTLKKLQINLNSAHFLRWE